MSRRNRFRAFDQRTGRLERAVNLLLDGEKRGIRTKEPDPMHPLSKPRVVGLDRAQFIPGIKGKATYEDAASTFYVGFTVDATLVTDTRNTQAFSLHSGGCEFDYTDVNGTFAITLGD